MFWCMGRGETFMARVIGTLSGHASGMAGHRMVGCGVEVAGPRPRTFGQIGPNRTSHGTPS